MNGVLGFAFERLPRPNGPGLNARRYVQRLACTRELNVER